jgi:hypothetical protein
MCIDIETKFYKEDCGRGYKVCLEAEDGSLRTLHTRDFVLEGVWVQAEKKSLPDIKMPYEMGHHIYLGYPDCLRDAASLDWQPMRKNGEKMVIKEVEFRGVITSGTESRYFAVAMGNLTYRVVVAREIRFLPVAQELETEQGECREFMLVEVKGGK